MYHDILEDKTLFHISQLQLKKKILVNLHLGFTSFDTY